MSISEQSELAKKTVWGLFLEASKYVSDCMRQRGGKYTFLLRVTWFSLQPTKRIIQRIGSKTLIIVLVKARGRPSCIGLSGYERRIGGGGCEDLTKIGPKKSLFLLKIRRLWC